MKRRRTLQDLYDLMGPQEAAKAKAMTRKKLETILLGEMRKRLGLTQAAVAKAMGISQSALSQMESQDDLQITTLRRLAKALGAELNIVLKFPDHDVVLKTAR